MRYEDVPRRFNIASHFLDRNDPGRTALITAAGRTFYRLRDAVPGNQLRKRTALAKTGRALGIGILGLFAPWFDWLY
jgi:hypothetical protein